MSILLTLCMVLALLPATAMAVTAAPATPTTGKVTGEDWTTFKDGRSYGYEDAAGKVVIPAQFEDASNFSQGIALVRQCDTDLYAYIDTTGKEVILLQYDRANSFQDGMAAVFQYQGMMGGVDRNKVGWIDTTGKMVIPYMSDDALYYDWSVHNFKDGLVCYFVETDNDPFTLPAADMNGIYRHYTTIRGS